MGTSQARSAVAAYWPDADALSCLAAFPKHPNLDQHGLQDEVSGLYREWPGAAG